MKKLSTVLAIAALWLCFFSLPVLQTGCSTAPDQRVQTVTTLLTVGHAAESSVGLSAQLYRDGRITAAQAASVNSFFDTKFQPAYRLAVVAANSDLSSVASPDLVNLASQLASLVAQFTAPTK